MPRKVDPPRRPRPLGASLPIKLGVSSCLLGQEVRYDAGHKRDRFVTESLADFVEWVPVCPEVEAGMGVPRPPMRLVRETDGIRLVEIESRRDHTRTMEHFAKRRVAELERLELSGYILKKDSPSCGMTRVKLFPAKGMPKREATGLFAAALMKAFPDLPVEDEGRLNNAGLCENFIERVFAYWRLRNLFAGRWTAGQLVAFHTAHKLQLMAHSPGAVSQLGRLVADARSIPRMELRSRYQAGFMAALSRMATRGRNTNVLQHAMGTVKQQLDSGSRDELADTIEAYRIGRGPLVVPLTLLAHHVRRLEIEDLQGQVFLEPHPQELMLRNHV